MNIKYIPLSSDGYSLDLSYLSSCLSSTSSPPCVVSLVHASNTLGTINNVSEVLSRVRSHPKGNDIAVILDASQSAPHTPVIPRSPSPTHKPDFVLFSSHKVMGPTGLGVIYAPSGASAYRRFLPRPARGGGEMIDSVVLRKGADDDGGLAVNIDYAKSSPRLYESGTPNIADVAGFKTALEVLQATEITRIHDYLEVSEYIKPGLIEILI